MTALSRRTLRLAIPAAMLMGAARAPSPARAAEPEASALSTSPVCADCNLIMISLSNVGAGRMSLFGYPRKTTPQLDRFAEHAVAFENAFTHASWTLPVGVSLFTSMYPYSHQVLRRLLKNALPADVKTLPEVLRDHGYRTAAFTGGLDYYVGFSHMRGFQDTKDNKDFSGFRTTLPEARSWLAKNSKHKFMLFIHGYDAHCPFNPEKPFKGTFSDPTGKNITVDITRCVRGFANSKDFSASYAGGCSAFREKCPTAEEEVRLTKDDVDYLSDLYDDKVFQVDTLVGGFLGALSPETLKKTIVVVFSDHGEMFEKHGRFGRAGAVRGTHHDDVLHVPLIMRFPDGKAMRVSGLVQMIDVMPTLLHALGVPAPPTIEGKDLAPLLSTGAAVNPYVYSGATYNYEALQSSRTAKYPYWTRAESIRDLHWKLIREASFDPKTVKNAHQRHLRGVGPPLFETFELYDIQADPEELVNTADAHPEVTKDLSAKLQSWVQKCASVGSRPAASKIPEKLLKAARERGYW
jgi:arylsulfatase A-like enzyme